MTRTQTSREARTAPAPPPAARHSRRLLAAAVLVALVSLALRAVVPLWVLAESPHDDQLFVRLGSSLASGHWLGPFNDVTLVKGPAFPMFLAVAWHLHLPPLMLLHVLHLLAAAVVGLAVARTTGSDRWAFGAYAALALDPSQYGVAASRLTREAWYGSWTLLLLGLFALLATEAARLAGADRRQAIRSVVGYGLLCGSALSVYWLSREERAWLLPALAVLVVAAALSGRARSRARWWNGWLPIAGVLLITTVTLQLSLLVVKVINDRQYGAPVVTDLVDGEFARTYTLWQSVLAGKDRRYVPISAAQREAVYAVSPAARELGNALEGPLAQAWGVHGCRTVQVCDDLAAGWIPFAMRDAMQVTGHFGTEREAQRFLDRIGDDIEHACDRGQLRCAPLMPALLPRPALIDVGAVGSSAVRSAKYLTTFELARQDRTVSEGSPEAWQIFRAGVRGVAATPAEAQAAEPAQLRRAHHLELMRRLYAVLAVLLLPVSLVGYVLAVARRNTGIPPLAVALGLAAGVAVLCRVVLLAVVDATSFPATQSAYALPAAAPLVLSLTIGTWCFVQAVPTLPVLGRFRRPSPH